jgi:hypothetical protein
MHVYSFTLLATMAGISAGAVAPVATPYGSEVITINPGTVPGYSSEYNQTFPDQFSRLRREDGRVW